MRCNTLSRKRGRVQTSLSINGAHDTAKFSLVHAARATPSYASAAGYTTPHSIIEGDVSSLICKRKFSDPTDQWRQHTRRNFFDPEFTEKIAAREAMAIPLPIGAIDWMTCRGRNQDRRCSYWHRASDTVGDQKHTFGPGAAHCCVPAHAGPLRNQGRPSPPVRFARR